MNYENISTIILIVKLRGIDIKYRVKFNCEERYYMSNFGYEDYDVVDKVQKDELLFVFDILFNLFKLFKKNLDNSNIKDKDGFVSFLDKFLIKYKNIIEVVEREYE